MGLSYTPTEIQTDGNRQIDKCMDRHTHTHSQMGEGEWEKQREKMG